MTSLKTFVAILLLALWVPLTCHALLEHAGWIHRSPTAAGSGEEHDAADGLCLIPSAGFELQKISQPAPLPIARVELILASLTAARHTCQNLLGALGLSPPILPTSWQFVLRAALPVRAPSFAS